MSPLFRLAGSSWFEGLLRRTHELNNMYDYRKDTSERIV